MPTFMTEDGAELSYKVEGNERGNPPLIFIHGWCSNLTHWQQQVSYFQDSHRILRMDRRGMGKSTTPGTGHTPAQHAADIAALARHEGLTARWPSLTLAAAQPGCISAQANLTRSEPTS